MNGLPIPSPGRFVRLIHCVATLVACAALGFSQSPIRMIASSNAPVGIGWEFASIGDQDADGIPDLAYVTNDTLTSPGTVEIVSGATGAPLATLNAPSFVFGLGTQIAAVGDTNGDAIPEFAMTVLQATPPVAGATRNGAVVLYAGALRIPIWQVFGATREYFGYRMRSVEDVDGDGIRDILASAPYDGFAPNGVMPNVKILSGATGAVVSPVIAELVQQFSFGTTQIWGDSDADGDGVNDITVTLGAGVRTYSGSTGTLLASSFSCAPLPLVPSCGYGSAVIGIGDRNGDGLDDFLVGVRGADVAGTDSGQVRIQTGTNFGTLSTIEGLQPGDSFGHRIESGGDFNGDGYADIAVTASRNFTVSGPLNAPGYVQILSGLDLSVLATIYAPQPNSLFGFVVKFVGDLDGDGSDEIAISAPTYYVVPFGATGAIFIYSSRSVLAAESGNVGLALGQPITDVLSVNGSFGGPDRRVNVGISQPITIGMGAPPTLAIGAPFALFGAVGVPSASGLTTTSVGDFVFPPSLLAPGVPWLFLLADNFTNTTAPILASTPAPWSTTLLSGVPIALQITLQGVVQQAPSGTPVQMFAITNAVQMVSP